jgi:hypothetical protein
MKWPKLNRGSDREKDLKPQSVDLYLSENEKQEIRDRCRATQAWRKTSKAAGGSLQYLADQPDIRMLEADELWERARQLEEKGHAQFSSYQSTGNLMKLDVAITDLCTAILLFHRAMGKTLGVPKWMPDWRAESSNIALALTIRYDRTRNLADLDESIEWYRDALSWILSAAFLSSQISTLVAPQFCSQLNNLCNVLLRRFNHTGNEADLDESIDLLRKVVSFIPKGTLEWTERVSLLIVLLEKRYKLRGNAADLEESIELGR